MADLSLDTLELLQNNLPLYSKAALQIRTKAAKMKPLEFNLEQKIINEVIAKQYQRTGRVRVIILKARQIGMSTYTSARFFRRLHLWPNQQAVVVADELSRAEVLFGMYDRYAHYLPRELKPMVRYATKKRELYFDNPTDRERAENPGLGSGIIVETAGDAAAGRGSTIQLAHLSEMASWPNALEVYISLIQAVPDEESEVIVESTANGVGNLFHQMWKAAEEGEGEVEGSNGYVSIFFPWWSHEEYRLPVSKKQEHEILETLSEEELIMLHEGIEWRGKRHVLDITQIAWRRKTIQEKAHGDERAFRQEYPSTPDEAFLVSGSAFFDADALKSHQARTISPLRRGYFIRPKVGGILLSKDERGYLRLWDHPEERRPGTDQGQVYVIGADTATGRKVGATHTTFDDPEGEKGGSDFSCADVLSVRGEKKQVAQLHGRMAPEVFAEQLWLLGNYYSTELPSGLRRPALIAVERNHSSGETVVNLLRKGHPRGRFPAYPNLYIHNPKRFARRGAARTPRDAVVGWVTNVETRQIMLDNLNQAIREGWLEVPCKETIAEMLTFVRDDMGKPQAQEGAHDDRVISLAIAAYVSIMESYELPKNYDKPTVGEWGRELRRERQLL